jgi:hypothetical protein
MLAKIVPLTGSYGLLTYKCKLRAYPILIDNRPQGRFSDSSLFIFANFTQNYLNFAIFGNFCPMKNRPLGRFYLLIE